MKKISIIAALFCVNHAVADGKIPIPLKDSIEYGQVGKVRLGESLNEIHKVLGRKVKLDYLGSNRGGTSLFSIKDMKKLQVAEIDGHPVSGLELMFIEVDGVNRLSFAAFIVDCSTLDNIQRQFPTSSIVENRKVWKYKSNNGKVLVGGSSLEVCNFWLREEKREEKGSN